MTSYGPLVRRRAKLGGALYVLGSVQFWVAMAVAQLAYPGYSLAGNYISDLGGPHSPDAWVFNDSIRVLGILAIVGAFLIRSAFGAKRSARVGLVFVGIAGLGAFLVGTFPEGSPELNGGIHSIVSLVTFLFSGFALLSLSAAMLRDTRWDGFRFYTFISGVVDLVALALYAAKLYGPLGPGGMERLIVAPILLWAVVVGIHLLRLPTYAQSPFPKAVPT
jgi:hypothetical membrane protein